MYDSMDPRADITLLLIRFTETDDPFKSTSDQRMKSIRRRHMQHFSPIIHKWQGILTGSEEALVTVRFPEPAAALKAAMGIQDALAQQNRGRNKEPHAYVAIGIHIGKGIITEDDVQGDVLEQTLKLTAGTREAHIRVSQPVYDALKGIPDVRFAACTSFDGTDATNGIRAYEAIRNESPSPSPPEPPATLILKPMWGQASHRFNAIWNHLIERLDRLKDLPTATRHIYKDKTLSFSFKDTRSSVETADRVIAYLRKRIGGNGPTPGKIPVKMIIDLSPLPETDASNTTMPDINWEKVHRGEIYISRDAHRRLNASIPYTVDRDETAGYYRLVLDVEEEAQHLLFPYSGALIHGRHAPCYYCGDRRHPASECPSKKLLQVYEGLEKAGYRSPQSLSALVEDHLKGSNSENTADQNHYSLMAKIGFYDLRKVFQLRFLMSAWGWNDTDWDTLTKREKGKDLSGPVWEALDTLRASNSVKTRKLLDTAPAQFNKDFRAACISGFLEMENDSFRLAERYFNEASEKTKTMPQKIFVLFQLFRLSDLRQKTIKAENRLKEILWFYHECSEALYREAIFKFRKGMTKEALSQLTALIKKEREFYVRALIDPELSPFSEQIQPTLERLLEEARESAEQIAVKAEAEIEKLGGIIGTDTVEFQKAEKLMQRIETLLKTESYFGCLEISKALADKLFSIGDRVLQERKTNVFSGLQEIERRCRRQLHFADNITYQLLIRHLRKQVIAIWKESKKTVKQTAASTPDGYRQVLDRITHFLTRLDETQDRMKKMHTTSQFLKFLFLLLKYNLIFQSINLLIVLVMIPVLVHYASTFEVVGHAFMVQKAGLFQKWVFFMGGLFWILVSVLTAIKKVFFVKKDARAKTAE